MTDARTHRLLLVVLVAAGLLLNGCCAINPFSRCTPEFTADITAQADLNSCTDQGSYPVKLRLYSLAGGDAFRAAEFETLWFEESDLDGAVLDQQLVTVEPGTAQRFAWERPSGTRLVGVVANFCQLDSGCWKHLVEVPAGSQQFVMDLAGTCMTVRVRE